MIESHKGEKCIYGRDILCQESYCMNCEIKRIFLLKKNAISMHNGNVMIDEKLFKELTDG
jgi:hypothetical protein